MLMRTLTTQEILDKLNEIDAKYYTVGRKISQSLDYGKGDFPIKEYKELKKQKIYYKHLLK